MSDHDSRLRFVHPQGLGVGGIQLHFVREDSRHLTATHAGASLWAEQSPEQPCLQQPGRTSQTNAYSLADGRSTRFVRRPFTTAATRVV
jgi:hypothetical protein